MSQLKNTPVIIQIKLDQAASEIQAPCILQGMRYVGPTAKLQYIEYMFDSIKYDMRLSAKTPTRLEDKSKILQGIKRATADLRFQPEVGARYICPEGAAAGMILMDLDCDADVAEDAPASPVCADLESQSPLAWKSTSAGEAHWLLRSMPSCLLEVLGSSYPQTECHFGQAF